MILDRVPTDDLIAELERRAREEPGKWNAYQERRIKELSDKLNPEPIS